MSVSILFNWLENIWAKVRSNEYREIFRIPFAFFTFVYSNLAELNFSEKSPQDDDSDVTYSRQPIKELNVHIVTWNVDSKQPPPKERILNLLKATDDVNNLTDPDLYAIGLQEAGTTLHQLSIGPHLSDLWVDKFEEVLANRDYVLLKYKQLLGVIVMCFVRRKYILQVRMIEAEVTRLGLGGLWGNKGGVSIRLSISGCTISFLNCHFAADENSPEDRIKAYEQILGNHRYKLEMNRELFTHDIVFWFGDLNFRLTWNNKLTPRDVEELIQSNERDQLLACDELINLQKEGRVFQGFIEKLLNFPPSFKYEQGTPYYNLKRKPAWTDRILYRVKPHPYVNTRFDVTQGVYTSYAECNISDHRPVASDFNIKFVDLMNQERSGRLEGSKKVYHDSSENIVEFDHISEWWINEENVVSYTLSSGFCEHRSTDWIAIYPENFDDLAGYIAYEYAGAYSSVDMNSSDEPSTSNRQQIELRKRKIRLNFSENSVNMTDGAQYVLLYLEQDEGGAIGVAGISNSFIAKSTKNSVEVKKQR